MAEDFYELRHTLKAGDVFRDCFGDLVKLDSRVPGDGTRWRVADWAGHHWSYEDGSLEPGDLMERADDPARPSDAA